MAASGALGAEEIAWRELDELDRDKEEGGDGEAALPGNGGDARVGGGEADIEAETLEEAGMGTGADTGGAVTLLLSMAGELAFNGIAGEEGPRARGDIDSGALGLGEDFDDASSERI